MKLLAATLALLGAVPARALDVSPLLDAQALGGQYFFGGQRADVSGDASLSFSPAVSVDDRWSVLPTVSSSYVGTKQVVELVGQGTVFEEQLNNGLGARAVYEAPSGGWRLKPFASAGYDLLKETRDEAWGKGLFDHWRWDMGGEAEYVAASPVVARARLTYFELRFPNYSTLESQQAVQAAGLARAGMGDFLLNTRNLAVETAVDSPVGLGLKAEGKVDFVYSYFPQQRVLDPTDAPEATNRQDLLTTWTAGVKKPVDVDTDLRGALGLSVSYAFNSSNQNDYDATQGLFLPLDQNYGEWSVGPSAQAFLGPASRPAAVSVSSGLAYRRWPHRPAQDQTGLYDGSPLWQRTWTASASVSYPLGERLSAVASAQWLRALSNQAYQQFYAYDYSATNFLVGFSYRY